MKSSEKYNLSTTIVVVRGLEQERKKGLSKVWYLGVEEETTSGDVDDAPIILKIKKVQRKT